MALRISARYGQDPFTWWDGLDEDRQALLIAQERILMAEDSKA